MAAVVGACLLVLGRRARRRMAVGVGTAWLLYAVYETGMRLRWLCSGECDIRIDLLVISPALLLGLAAAVVACSEFGPSHDPVPDRTMRLPARGAGRPPRPAYLDSPRSAPIRSCLATDNLPGLHIARRFIFAGSRIRRPDHARHHAAMARRQPHFLAAPAVPIARLVRRSYLSPVAGARTMFRRREAAGS